VQNYIRGRTTFESKLIDSAFKENLTGVEVIPKKQVRVL
jgi:hypothetical protein